MYELVQVSEHCYYIQSPAKIGLIRISDQEVVLIDSGNDKDAGKKVKRILDSSGWHLQAIYNTHSHADHIGGNRYLQTQTGCHVYVYGIDKAFTAHPVLEPSYLYGGTPPAELKHKFLMAQASNAESLSADVLPDGLEIIPLPGHSFDMVGFRSSEGIVYLADCLSSKEALAKYQVSFLVNVKEYLRTLEAVKSMEADLYIPAHADVTDSIGELAQYNIDHVMEIGDRIVEFCREPLTFEQILQQTFRAFDLTMTFEQHALVGSTVRSYLTWLKGENRLGAYIENNMLLWRAL